MPWATAALSRVAALSLRERARLIQVASLDAMATLQRMREVALAVLNGVPLAGDKEVKCADCRHHVPSLTFADEASCAVHLSLQSMHRLRHCSHFQPLAPKPPAVFRRSCRLKAWARAGIVPWPCPPERLRRRSRKPPDKPGGFVFAMARNWRSLEACGWAADKPAALWPIMGRCLRQFPRAKPGSRCPLPPTIFSPTHNIHALRSSTQAWTHRSPFPCPATRPA